MNRLRTIAVTMLSLFATWTPPTLILGASTVAMTGCSTATLTADAQGIATVAKQIADAIATEAPQVSIDLITAANDLSSLATALAGGTTTQAKVLAAVGVIDTILGTIPNPVTQTISQFLPIVVAAIIALYNQFGQPAAANAVTVNSKPRATDTIKPAAIHHRFLRSGPKDFEAAWNEASRMYPTKGIVAL